MKFHDARSDWETFKVPFHADDGRVDERSIYFGKFAVFETVSTHLREMSILGPVAMILLDYWVEELVKYPIGTGRARINTNTAIFTSATCHDAGLESNTLIAFLVLVIVPQLPGEELVAAVVIVWVLHEFALGLVLSELESEVRQVGLINFLGGLLLRDDAFVSAYAVQSVSH